MATVFHLPMPVLDDAQNTQIRQQRRRRDSIEVIDVDELDDDLYQAHRSSGPDPSRPATRRRVSAPSEVISLVDSDEEDIMIPASNVRPASRTRLQSPPPRNLPWGYVPPVPQVPHRYVGQTSLPMRRHGPAYSSPPIIRPNDHPFPFEANIHQRQPAPGTGPGPSNQPLQFHVPRENDHDLPPRPLQPAPPSHHVPALGLGGALIAQNRARQQQQLHHRPPLPYEVGNSFLGRVGSGVRRILGGPALAPDEGPRNQINFFALGLGNNFGFVNDPLGVDDEDLDRTLALQLLAEEEGEGLRDWDPAFNPARAFIRSEVLRRRNSVREESPYRKEYTHPQPPEPGFTFDFAPKSPVEVIDVTSPMAPKKHIPPSEPIIIDDEEGSVLTSLGGSTISGSASSSASPSIPTSRPRLHTPPRSTSTNTLVCAHCLDPLVLSNNLTSDDQKNCRVWALRCGHLIDGKCLKEIGQPHYPDQPAGLGVVGGVSSAGFGRKGKGKAKAEVDDEEYDDHLHLHAQEQDNNSIRSRLRPRQMHSTAGPSLSSHSPTKRTTRAKQPLQMPPPDYIWHCPVAGCGRVHVSVKINGEWIPERDDGNEIRSGGGVNRRGRRHPGGRRGRMGPGLSYPGTGDTDHWNGNWGGGPSEGPRGAIPLFL